MPVRVPVVFISSTCEDLEDYGLAARDAALNEGFMPDMLEYFTPGGERPPVEECLAQVAKADVVVAVCARRYGWKPDGQDGKSITWLECLHAAGNPARGGHSVSSGKIPSCADDAC
ncbi:MAG: DUF4062 domain-containing protein [Bryobacteraceae bacterium]